jgi:Icc-related predicted phosphoesterase
MTEDVQNVLLHFNTEQYATRVRFVCMSDTHDLHDYFNLNDIPEGDVLIHTGDFTNKGEEENINNFNTFLGKMKQLKQFKYVVVVAGNHDIMMDPEHNKRLGEIPEHKHPLLSHCDYYLQDNAIDLEFGEGRIKIYGTPWTALKMAFACPNEKERAEKWRQIPENIDILLTHVPPLNILDLSDIYVPKKATTKPAKECTLCGETHQYRSHLGCSSLRNEILNRLRPRVHVFGHVHACYGTLSIKHEDETETTFVNAACKWSPLRKPMYFDYYV